MPRTALFRFDASPTIGGGHAMRCLTLAQALRQHQWRCTVTTCEATLAAVPHLAQQFDRIVLVSGSPGDEVSVMTSSLPRHDLAICDHYQRDGQFESDLYRLADAVLVFDDLPNRPHHCDWILDPTPGRKGHEYQSVSPEGCRLLTGPDFALLRPEFRRRRPAALGRETSARCDTILVSMGLTDPSNATEKIIRSVRDLDYSRLVVALGSTAPHLASVAQCLKSVRGGVLVVNPDDMSELYAQADLCIGAGGSSSLERCCMGVPSLILVTAENQRDLAAALTSTGAAAMLDAAAVDGDLAATIGALAQCRSTRSHMRARAKNLCDGRGAQRVLLALDPRGAGNQPVSLRLIEDDDCALIFAWQNAPDARMFSHNPHPPSLAEHTQWFAAARQNPMIEMSRIMVGETKSGLVRLERLGDGRLLVSILVAREAWGKGIGSAALRYLVRLSVDEHLLAEIHPLNVPSQKAFQGAGFIRTGEWTWECRPRDTDRTPSNDCPSA